MKRTRLIGLLAGLTMMASAGQAQAYDAFNWWGTGGCTVPVVGMPVDFNNVKDRIPADLHSKVITVGPNGTQQAGLLFVFIKCPTNRIEGAVGDPSTGEITQVLIGVLYEAKTAEDIDKAQFYLLASLNSWAQFKAAEATLELPSSVVPGQTMNLVRDPATGLGTFDLNVPWSGSPFIVNGQITAANPIREWPQDAVHFFRSSLGMVRVHHDEAWAPGNAAEATVTAFDPTSQVARWMGGTSKQAVGLYVWIHDDNHVHRYEVTPGG